MKMLFIFAIITITGCVGGKYNVHKTRIGTLILTYEKAYLDSVEYYFSKYDQIYLGDKKYDYTDWVLPESAIDSIIEKLILKEYPNVTYEQVLNDSRNKIEYYSLMKESGQYLYSNFMFIDNNDKNIVRIVLSVRGKFFFINNGNRGLLKNRESIHYCPVKKIPLKPPCVVLFACDSMYAPSNLVVRNLNLRPLRQDSLKIFYCD